ncbi:hypothetical protein F0U61_36995 [Archangium violaceum]|uniref:chitobiase/beta-hexosaminidase C-terminal domain-containing protein n=1 Tax=Archangium violaceum TaxID=83451 RepID=UPI002B3249B4|nr:hypothetical protein F0U61_36995 [Archangium violaceum]
MLPTASWSSRLVLALLSLHLSSACKPNPPPPPASDTTPPSSRATPNGGTFKENISVTLLCDDGAGSGCDATYYTTDGSTPSASSPRYSEPLTLTTHTTLKFFSVDKAGNTEPAQTAAYIFPTSIPSVSASPAGGIYRTAREVTLTCTDTASGSGCASIHYTTDGSVPDTGSATYTAPLTFSSNTTLKFVGVGPFGNRSAVQTEVYLFDTSAPTTTATPAGGTYHSQQSITLTCADSGGSECAATYYTLDGSTPTTSSTLYTGPFSLSTDTTLKFFSVDKVGNEETARTEAYVFDLETTAPTTFASPPAGTYTSEQSIYLNCYDDGGSGCAATYYTLDGSTPTTSSTRYTGAPISFTGYVTLRFFSVDNANNAESPKSEPYVISTPANTSAQIATIRSKPDGAISDPIEGALVTYTKPVTGADPAGFFLQSEKNGPAIFVAADFARLGVEAGDRMTLRATEKTMFNGMVQISKFDNWIFYKTRTPVEFLLNDVSGIDLVTKLNDYESELISITGTVTSPLASAGSGNVAANFVTLGNPASDPNLKLRLPTRVADALDVTQDCSVTTKAPLWRFNTQAQPSAWVDSDLTILSCPGPKVTGAVAGGSTSVTVNFDRKLDPDSVFADGSQFTFDNGLVASAAIVSGRLVQLTTSTQEPNTVYTVTVASGVKDTRGSDLQTAAHRTTFTTGAGITPAVLRLTEVAPGINLGKDLVELLVVQGGTVDKFTLMQGASTILATFPNVLVATGDIIVVHLKPTTAPVDAPAFETSSKSEFAQSVYGANYDSAWDFLGGPINEIGYSQRVLRVRDATGVTQDGASFYRPPGGGGGGVTSDFYAQLQSLQDEGHWLPVNCGGVPCSGTSTPMGSEVSVDWANLPTTKNITVRRVFAMDNNTATDWAVGASSFGLPNP